MIRRRFLAALAVVTGTMFAQKAIIEGKEAVVCDSESVKCSNGHATCKSINAPLAVGNDREQNPEVEQLFQFHVLRCEVCHVLFTRE